jgi:hypothetical protein
LIKFDDKERSGKLNLELVVNLVDRPKLFEGLICELEHVFFLIKLPEQYSWCIFLLIWSDLFVSLSLEVVFRGNMCGLVQWRAAVDERLEIFHI